MAPVLIALALAGCGGRPWVHGSMMTGDYPYAYGPGTGMWAHGCPYSGLVPNTYGSESRLSQDQQQRIHEIRRGFYQSQLQNERELTEAMQDWETAVQRPEPDTGAAASARDRAVAIQQEMLRERLEAQDRIQEIISQPSPAPPISPRAPADPLEPSLGNPVPQLNPGSGLNLQ